MLSGIYHALHYRNPMRRGESWHSGTSNYEVIREWNKASVYVQTISVMADKIARGG